LFTKAGIWVGLLIALILLPTGCNQKDNPADPMQYVLKQGSKVTIAHKYSSTDDLWIVFDHFGANRLYSFSQWRLAANDGERVNPDLNRASSVLQNALSDWIGPYYVKANRNGTGSSAEQFTGGAHAYNGNDTGSATARTVSVQVTADGVELQEGVVVPSDQVELRVVNRIQGYNTKLEDGRGREILQETIRYTVTGGRVQVHAEIEALEDVAITRYYGLQTVNYAWNGDIAYMAGDRVVSSSPVKANSDSGKLPDYPDIDWLLISSANEQPIRHRLEVRLDRSYGLGTMEHVAAHRPAAFTYEYGKSYFLQIMEKAYELPARKTISWRGSYRFYSTQED